MIEFGTLFLKIFATVVSGLFVLAVFFKFGENAAGYAVSGIEKAAWVAAMWAVPSAYIAAVVTLW